MAVVHSWHNLPEEVAGLPLRDVFLVADVVVQVPSAGVLHHYHNFVLVLEHCGKYDKENLDYENVREVDSRQLFRKLLRLLIWAVENTL